MSLSRLILIFLCFSIVLMRPGYAWSQSSNKKPVVIAQNDWASQRVLSIVMGRLLQRVGVSFRLQEISTDDQWGALSRGQLDIQVEVWQGTMAEQYERIIASKSVLDAGTHKAKTREDWWFPDYVMDMCYGLPDWRALKHCSLLFRENEKDKKGAYYSGPWDHNEGKTIRALDLAFNVRRLAYDEEHWQNLLIAIENKSPILLFNWTPNWTDTRLKGRFVEFPEFNPLCEQDKRWGVNDQLTHDCGNPKDGWLKKIASINFKNNYPCGWDLLNRVNFTTDMISEASAYVVIDHLPEEEAALAWMQKYSEDWSSWVTESVCRQ